MAGRLVKGEVSLAQAASDAGFVSEVVCGFLAAIDVFVFESSLACSPADICLCLCLCISHVFVICESLSLSPFIIMLTMMTTKLMLMMVPGLPQHLLEE